jgi:hypothetical protein
VISRLKDARSLTIAARSGLDSSIGWIFAAALIEQFLLIRSRFSGLGLSEASLQSTG